MSPIAFPCGKRAFMLKYGANLPLQASKFTRIISQRLANVNKFNSGFALLIQVFYAVDSDGVVLFYPIQIRLELRAVIRFAAKHFGNGACRLVQHGKR